MRAISKKRSERFQSMAEMNDALEDLRKHFGDGTLALAETPDNRSWIRKVRDLFRR